MPAPQFFILIVIALVAGGMGVWAWHEQRRRAAMAVRARDLGLDFAGHDAALPPPLAALPLFGRGRRRRVRNHMAGRIEDIDLQLFDYHYTTGGGKNQSTHRMTVIALRCPAARLPRFSLRPEHFGHRLAELVGFDDIDFDDDGPNSFSRRFRLTGDVEDAIRARFTSGVRAQFEALDGIFVEAAQDWIVVHHGHRRARPEALERLVEEAFGVATSLGSSGTA